MAILTIPFPAPGSRTGNSAPAASGATLSINENVGSTTLGTVGATDRNTGDTLTYSITAGNGAGKFAIHATNGALSTTGTLDYETTAQYALTVKVEDDEGLYDTATITVNVGDVNEAPVAVGATLSIAENNTGTIGTVAATDVDGDTLTYSITAGDSGNKFSINASTGVLVATGSGLDFEDDTQHVLTITVSDSALTHTATITVNVTDTNEPPVAVGDTRSIVENSTATIGTVAATDPDGDTLTYSITAGDSGNKFSINASTGVLVATGSGLDYEDDAQHVLTVTVSDSALTHTATITVNVTDTNEAPVAVGATLSIAENNTGTIGTVGATDPDGDTLTYSITAGDSGNKFSINASSGVLVATGSGLDFEDDTQHVLTVTVSDSALTHTATITVNVTNVNEAPVAVGATLSIAENNTGTIGTVAATDPEGDTLTYSITAGDSGNKFSINASSGVLVATGSGLNYEDDTQHVLTITVSDSALTHTATITVNVTDVNEAPVAVGGTLSIAENSTATITTVAATDVDGDTLTYSITAGDSGNKFSINASTGVLVATGSGLNYEDDTQHVLTVTVSDSALTHTATITVNVIDLNEAPVAVGATMSIAENSTSAIGTVGATDVDGDTLTYSITAGDSGNKFSINASSGVLVATGSGLDFEDDAQHVLTVTVSDSALTHTATITVNVTNVNEAPVAVGATLSIAENSTSAIGTVGATDPESDTLTYSITAGDSGNKFSINASSGVLVATGSGLDFEDDAQHVLTVTVSDSALSHAATITVNVTNVNEAPVAVGATLSVNENLGVTAVGTVGATDPESDTLTYSITAGNGAGKFAIHATTGVLSTTGTLDHEDDDQYVLTVTVSDSALSHTATITVNVGDVNEAPVAVGATMSIAENSTSAIGTVSASDVDDDTLTYSITAGDSGNQFSINASTGVLVATGSGLDYETDTQHVLTVTVSDSALTHTATITVNVTDVSEAVGSVPTNEFVFDEEQTSSGQSLSMTDTEWSTPGEPDLSTQFGILMRVTLEEKLTSGERWPWADWESFTTTSFGLRLHSNGRLYWKISASSGSHGNVYTGVDEVEEGVETLLYATYVSGTIELFLSTGNDTPASVMSASMGTPTEGTGEVVFGGRSPTAWSWYGTIHQPIFFAGGTIPTNTEIGTANTPVALNTHASVFSIPDADNLPADEAHSEAWTNNNSLTVQTHAKIAIPVKEHLFGGGTTSAPALSMDADDFGTFDGEKWAVFFRFTFVRNGFTYLANYYDYYDSAAARTPFAIRAWSTAQFAVFTRNSAESLTAHMYGTFDHQDDTTYLLYLIFDTADGGSAPGGNDYEMYYGVGDSALALDQSIADVGFDAVDVPTASTVQFIIGANQNFQTGTEINIHQMAMYSGGYPGLTEVGTADTPVALPDTNMKFHLDPDTSEVADHILSTAWTNNNSVTTDDH